MSNGFGGRCATVTLHSRIGADCESRTRLIWLEAKGPRHEDQARESWCGLRESNPLLQSGTLRPFLKDQIRILEEWTGLAPAFIRFCRPRHNYLWLTIPTIYGRDGWNRTTFALGFNQPLYH